MKTWTNKGTIGQGEITQTNRTGADRQTKQKNVGNGRSKEIKDINYIT